MSYNISGGVVTPQVNLKSGTFSAQLVPAGSPASNVNVVVPHVATTLATIDTAQTLTNKTLTSTTNNINAKGLPYDGNGGSSGTVDVYTATSAPVANRVLVATSATAASWLTPSMASGNVTGTLAVANGGTGATTHTSGNFLVGAGTSAVTSAKVAPSGVVIGTTDTQTLTNKTITATNNTVAAKQLLYDGNGGTAGAIDVYTATSTPASSQALFATSATTAVWRAPLTSDLVGVLPVTKGGTGGASWSLQGLLTGNGTDPLTTTLAPNGTIVGTSDTQTLTNKTITGGTNVVHATHLRNTTGAVTVSGSAAPSSGQSLIATGTSNAAWQNVDATTLTGTLTVANGGTGLATLTSGSVLVGAGTSAVTFKTAPSGAICGTTDTQTLTNKTITGATNTVHATHLRNTTGAVNVDGSVAPSAGQVLTAINVNTAEWATTNVATVAGTLSVQNGGTGVTSLDTGNLLLGNGTGNVLFKPSPSGAVVGTTDLQTLTNKSITGTTNTIHATHLRTATNGVNVDMSAAPVAGQILTAGGTSIASWQTPAFRGMAHLADVKTTGTDAGASVALSTVNRAFTLQGTTGSITITTPTSTSFRLTQTGDFIITGSAPGYQCGRHQIWLYNNTAGSTVVTGCGADSDIYVQTPSTIFGIFTNTGTNDYLIKHYTTTLKSVNGLGRNVGSGESEVYTSFTILRI